MSENETVYGTGVANGTGFPRDPQCPPAVIVGDDRYMREFLGYLSGAIPELHQVEVPRLADAWEQFKAANPRVDER
jgi:hypothetical protein